MPRVYLPRRCKITRADTPAKLYSAVDLSEGYIDIREEVEMMMVAEISSIGVRSNHLHAVIRLRTGPLFHSEATHQNTLTLQRLWMMKDGWNHRRNIKDLCIILRKVAKDMNLLLYVDEMAPASVKRILYSVPRLSEVNYWSSPCSF